MFVIFLKLILLLFVKFECIDFNFGNVLLFLLFNIMLVCNNEWW